MKILYYNNCWFTNVGEAFIDIGSMYLLKKIFPKCQLINISSMNKVYFNLVSKREAIENPNNSRMKLFNMIESYSGDYIVLPGMFATNEFLKSTAKDIEELSSRGVKVIFLGLGQNDYSTEETENFKRYIDKIHPVLIVSRDNVTYENFASCCPTINGLDCAFWVKDVYNPRNATVKEYNVVTYNRSPEPERMKSLDNVVRAYHMNWGIKTTDFKENFFMSDTPYDYLTLYANANRVYTDLVHATIVSLQYERHVKFEPVDKRGYAIESLEDIEVDELGFQYIKEQKLEKQKNDIENKIMQYFDNMRTK